MSKKRNLIFAFCFFTALTSFSAPDANHASLLTELGLRPSNLFPFMGLIDDGWGSQSETGSAALIGGGMAVNPADASGDSFHSVKSGSLNLLGTAKIKRETPFGFFGVANYLSVNQYAESVNANSLDDELRVPIVYLADTSRSIQFTPFLGYSVMDGVSYYLNGGARIRAAFRSGHYENAVESVIFSDHFFNPSLNNQEGWHFRFRYSWRWTSKDWDFLISPFLEHVQAGRDRTPPLRNISFAHNLFGGYFITAYEGLTPLSLFFDVRLMTRQDAIDSHYSSSGTAVVKRRQDFVLMMAPTILYRLDECWQLALNYRWTHAISNFDASDFLDANFSSHAFTFGILWNGGMI